MRINKRAKNAYTIVVEEKAKTTKQTRTPGSPPDVRVLVHIFTTMLKIGFFTFGGGYAMIPQMSRDFVEKNRWIPQEDITDLLAVAQSLPGVLAVNTALLVGYRIAGMAGALVAALGAMLPSIGVLSVVTVLYHAFIDNPYVLGALKGIRAGVTGLLLAAVWTLWKSSVRGLPGWVLFAGALAVTVFVPSLNLIFILLAGGLTGYALTLCRQLKVKRATRHEEAGDDHA